jgi:L-ascorbate metabolism protein UlaG (beta-lactamase superfamily)
MPRTRRQFLISFGAGILGPQVFFDGEERPTRSRWSMIFSNYPTDPVPLKPDPGTWKDDTITATWIGHATVLLNFFGTRIITDPVFSHRIGINLLGLATIGPNRLVEPALQVAELPRVDLILVSHAHMDHLDIPSLARFNRAIPLVVAKNTIDVIDHLGWEHARELDWGESAEVAGVRIEALQVKHFGWRYPWEIDRSRGNWEGRSFNAYLLTKNNHVIVFGGDTAYHENFRVLGRRGVSVDLAILPIGAYNPWIRNHCTPEQAVEMAHHMNAKTILPIHWGTFLQSDEPRFEPIERFRRALEQKPNMVALESVGQTWVMNGHWDIQPGGKMVYPREE